jgi:hypothetical protein
MRKPKFTLGREVMTRGVSEWINYDGDLNEDRYRAVVECMKRHATGDWGDVPPEDKEMNDFGVDHGNRLLSSYTVEGVTIWIITEADRSSTTVLFPDEY